MRSRGCHTAIFSYYKFSNEFKEKLSNDMFNKGVNQFNCFADLSKCYDTVDRTVLTKVLLLRCGNMK